jgi:Zn-dependent protease with chaperone function
MFALRCLAVCLSFFGVVYAAVSLLVSQVWRYGRFANWRSSRRSAKFLINLRTLPLLSAALVTAGVVLPSFLWLEPRAAAEPVGEMPAVLAAFCLLLFGAGFRNGLVAWQRTSRAVRGWLAGASEEPACHGVSRFRIRRSGPGLVVAGIREPRVLMSDAIADALTAPELAAALRHELAHVRRHDNLKKLFLRCMAFPGMAGLDAAVSNIAEALDLASALIKLSRCAPAHAVPALTTALMPNAGSALNARIERLIHWDQRRHIPPQGAERWYLAPALIGSMFCLAMSYGTLLNGIHQMTEWLVR